MVIKATYHGTLATDLNKMQSRWIGLFGVLLVSFSLSQAIPVDVAKTDEGAETRIIIPPELPPRHFELLKEKSENGTKDKPDEESTPLNFLRGTTDPKQNGSVVELKPTVILEGNKQTPIYITIPIYITTSVQPPQILTIGSGEPVVAPGLRKVPTPQEAQEDDEIKDITMDDIRKAFAELVRDAYRNERRPARGKGKVHRRNFPKTDYKKIINH